MAKPPPMCSIRRSIALVLLPLALISATSCTILSIRDIKRKADAGDAEAQYRLGFMYRYSPHMERDFREAFNWLTKSAEQGNQHAQHSLGQMYHEGLGGGTRAGRDEKAVEWYLKAAGQGNRNAYYSLGFCHFHGKCSLPQNHEEGIKWFIKAAETGHTSAQYTLATAHHDGKGVARDLQKAYMWAAVSAHYGSRFGEHKVTEMAGELTAQELAEAEAAAREKINQLEEAQKR